MGKREAVVSWKIGEEIVGMMRVQELTSVG